MTPGEMDSNADACRSSATDVSVCLDGHPGDVVRILPSMRGAVDPIACLHRQWRVDGYCDWLQFVGAAVPSCPVGMTAAYAVKLAASTGLRLMRAKNRSGFKHVVYRGNVYRAQVKYTSGYHKLGCFRTPEEAALCIAWWHMSRMEERVSTVEPTPMASVFAMPMASASVHLPFRFDHPRVMRVDSVSLRDGLYEDMLVDDDEAARLWVDNVLNRWTDVGGEY